MTNGTSVSLRESGLDGEVLAWVDALHEGPVPADLEPEQLRRVRGRFLDATWPGEISAIEELARRDAALENFDSHEEVVLWFEHDLYDQLQLIQILDRLRARTGAGARARGVTRLSLICIDRYLGGLTGAQLAALWPARRAVTPGELELAAAAWRAFRSPDPEEIEKLLHRDTSGLPFLDGALWRHLQQFPSTENGLARTQQQILQLVRAGTHEARKLFIADRQMEERIFMGDGIFFNYLRGLTECPRPLLEERRGEYHLTEAGRDVLAARADHVRQNGIDRWLGGVHLHGNEAPWRWDERARRMAARNT